MIVHIMVNTVFTAPYIEFVLAQFDPREQRFLVVEGPNAASRPLPDAAQVEDVTDRFRSLAATPALLGYLAKKTKDADLVVLHGMFMPRVVAFLALTRRVARRTCWVIWGADVHVYLGPPRMGVVHRLYGFARRRAVRSLAFLVPLVPGDVEAVEAVYGVEKPWILGRYMNPVPATHLAPRGPEARARAGALRVLVGNAASPSNRHAEALRLLSRFSDERIEVIAPLSYGDPAYAQSVRDLGTALFAEKFRSLDEMLSKEEYADVLNSIDVAVFNHARQEGLGNYYALAYLGAKVYSDMSSPSTRFLADEMGVPLSDIDDLASITFDEFAHFTSENRLRAQRAGHAFYDPAELRKTWAAIFEAVLPIR